MSHGQTLELPQFQIIVRGVFAGYVTKTKKPSISILRDIAEADLAEIKRSVREVMPESAEPHVVSVTGVGTR